MIVLDTGKTRLAANQCAEGFALIPTVTILKLLNQTLSMCLKETYSFSVAVLADPL